MPETASWTCPACGAENGDRSFCGRCAEARPGLFGEAAAAPPGHLPPPPLPAPPREPRRRLAVVGVVVLGVVAALFGFSLTRLGGDSPADEWAGERFVEVSDQMSADRDWVEQALVSPEDAGAGWAVESETVDFGEAMTDPEDIPVVDDPDLPAACQGDDPTLGTDTASGERELASDDGVVTVVLLTLEDEPSARAALDYVASQESWRCIEAAVGQAAEEAIAVDGVTLRSVRVEPRGTPPTAGPDSAAFRVAVELEADGRIATVVGDGLHVRRGRAVAQVIVMPGDAAPGFDEIVARLMTRLGDGPPT